MSQAWVDVTSVRPIFKRKLRSWLELGGHWLYPSRPRFRNRHFWVVLGLVIFIAAIHDIVEATGFLHDSGVPYFIPVSLFLVPVVYAALTFGFAGVITTALWATVITIPNFILWHQGLERFGVMFQMLVVIAVAYFLGRRVDRERNAWQQAEAATVGLRAYAARVTHAQEEERQRIARELHDDPIQALVLLCRRLDSMEGDSKSLPSSVTDRLREARRTAEEVVKGLRDFARALRPPILDDLGMVTSVRRLLADFMERTRIEDQLKVAGEEQRLPPDTELGMFRIAQEALWNVERHAGATHVAVTITFAKHQARLDVVDNGQGFSMPSVSGDFTVSGQLGLISMQERAELLGGKLEIQSNPGKGTRVTVLIPVADGIPEVSNHRLDL